MKSLPRVAVPIAWMVVIWILSSLPATAEHTLEGVWIPPIVQKAGHVAAYAFLAAAWSWALASSAWGTPLRIFTLCVFYGAANEVNQIFVPGRTASVLDVPIDAVGAATALVVLTITARSRVVSIPRAERGQEPQSE